MTIKLIDLRSHILPDFDDGARDIDAAVAMARAAVAGGIHILAATPRIKRDADQEAGSRIREQVGRLQRVLDEEMIPLKLVAGAENQLIPDFVAGLNSGRLLPLGDTRYALVVAPNDVPPPRLGDMFFSIMTGGYRPILAHPERLNWLKSHYDLIRLLARRGVWLQVTVRSITGLSGADAQYWAERMLAEGLVHILATDARDTDERSPNLSEAYERASKIVGAKEAERLVYTRPLAILNNQSPAEIDLPHALSDDMDPDLAGKLPFVHQTNALNHKFSDGHGATHGLSAWMHRLFS